MADNDRGAPFLPFAVVRRGGYDRAQVSEFFARYDAENRVLTADRDAAASHARELAEHLEEARREIDALRHDVDRLSVPPTTAEGMSDRISRMLRLASDEASEIRARAEAEAAEIVSVASQEANDLRADVQREHDEILSRRAAMEAEHERAIGEAKEEAARILASASAQRDQLDAESKARRDRIEEDFELAIAERRTKSIELIEKTEAESKARAAALVDESTKSANRRLQAATEQSSARIAQAKELTEELRVTRARVLEQLMAVRGQLDEIPTLLAASDREAQLLDRGLDPFTGVPDRPLADPDSEPATEAFAKAAGSENSGQDNADAEPATVEFEAAQPAHGEADTTDADEAELELDEAADSDDAPTTVLTKQ